MKNTRHFKKRFLAAGVCLGAFAGGCMAVQAQESQADAIAQLQKQNATLQKRLDAMETNMEDQGYKPDGRSPSPNRDSRDGDDPQRLRPDLLFR
jgi:cell division protein FtsB